ncbi:MAG: CBS domain-containing protein [Rhodospirillaceae bacterium]|nr:CBS domain-containing protein [Rhodospirillaceae bacterium]
MSEHTNICVRDIMTTEIKTITGMATVAQAVDLMRDSGVSSIIVERRDEADEFGMIVVSDIAAEVIAKGRAADRVNVYEIMTKPVLTVPMDMNIRYAVRLLVQFGLSRALVVDEGRTPSGIVTLRDMVLRHGESD